MDHRRWKIVSFTALVLSIISVSILIIQYSEYLKTQKTPIQFEIIEVTQSTVDPQLECYQVTIKYVGRNLLVGQKGIKIIIEADVGENVGYYIIQDLSDVSEKDYLSPEDTFSVGVLCGENVVIRIVWETGEGTKEERLTLEGIEIKNGLEEDK